MIKLSPRGYVFIGLEIIREPLIKIIGTVLPKYNQSWWSEFIHPRKVSYDTDFPLSGKVNDLYRYLDELDCFYIMKDNYKLFREFIDYYLIKELIEIRHECIHIYRGSKKSVNNFADDTLLKIACAMDKIDKEAQKTILSYRSEFCTQIINENTIIASKDELVNYLKDRVWDKSFKILDDIDTIDKEEIKELKAKMLKAYTHIKEKLQSATDVVNWFNSNLCSFEGIQMYLWIKSVNNEIPTFEDVRIGFYSLCYDEY